MAIKKSSMTVQAPFANVPGPDLQRSTFNRSKKYATTFDADVLFPIFMEPVYSGDVSEMKPSYFVRFFSALKLPNFDNLYFETFWFYVRNRLLWDHYANFNGYQPTPGASVDYTIPQVAIPASGYVPHTLYNYMGFPAPNNTDSWAGKTTNALPARAYALTFNDWFRDENYCLPLDFSKGDGPDASGTSTVLAKRMKRPDRFTSMLPAPQKGPDVQLPIAGNVSVYGVPNTPAAALWSYDSTQAPRDAYFDGATNHFVLNGAAVGGSPGKIINLADKAQLDDLGIPSPVYADLASATMANVNNIRLLFQIQRVYEKDMRGGTRDVEFYKVHFGVTVPDFTIQRPELIATSSDRIMINPVAQTSESATTPQGTLTAFGVLPPTAGGAFIKSYDEHGWLMCLANIRADVTYSQGIDKFWSQKTRFDVWLPTFNHLGEEAVYQREIFLTKDNIDDVSDSAVIGYQERWFDLRYPLNQYTGYFAPQVADNLSAYHLGLYFTDPVTVNQEFMESNTPIDRIVAVTDEASFFVQAWFDHKMTRSLPMFSVPGLIDHF